MTEKLRNYIIRDLIRVLKGSHSTYWQLYKLDDIKLLTLYEMLVDKDQQNVSLKGLNENKKTCFFI